ncbi:MAG: spore cortex biosynthesis protein YabQ [Clostridia bacterium]|nr:spore cortex biosynthesis protein YabQ [Clostridia bacterium]
MTFFETAGQGRVFLLLLYAGAGAALCYDALSLPRRHLPRPFAILADWLWCLMTAALCLGAVAMGQESRLRLYALLGMLCGAGIYCLGVRQIGIAVARLIRKDRKKRTE